MPTDPIDSSHPDLVRVTEILQELTSTFANGGFQSEIREPYREYGTETPGRDLKVTHVDAPAYYAAIKVSIRSDGPRLIAQSATFLPPGLAVRNWSQPAGTNVPYSEVLQFITEKYNDFLRDQRSKFGA